MTTHNSSDVQKLLGEKEQLKKEEEVLRSMIDKVKKQINAAQVEQLQIKSRQPLDTSSLFLNTAVTKPQETLTIQSSSAVEETVPEINLDILGNFPTAAAFAADQGEVEEEDE